MPRRKLTHEEKSSRKAARSRYTAATREKRRDQPEETPPEQPAASRLSPRSTRRSVDRSLSKGTLTLDEYCAAAARGLVGPAPRPDVKDDADEARRWLGIDVGSGSSDTFHVARRPAAVSRTDADYPEPDSLRYVGDDEEIEEADHEGSPRATIQSAKHRLRLDLEAGRISVAEAQRRYELALTEQLQARAADPLLDPCDLDPDWRWTFEDPWFLGEEDEYDSLAHREGADLDDFDDRPEWERNGQTRT